jgi:hypothetical protein
MSDNEKFEWERTWFPASTRAPFFSGFLPERDEVPETQDGVSFDALRDVPCLVLLGLPGMGKTHEMARQATIATDHGDKVTFVSVGRLANVADLETIVWPEGFEQSAISSSTTWALFFDGIDEAVAQPAQIEKAIPGILRRLAQLLPLERLRVRISCRTAEWPSSLEAELRTIWNDDLLQVYELGQLRSSDVATAAKQTDLANFAEEFLEQVRMHDAELLASRPVTLKMLLNLFGNNSTLPTSQARLYRRGLLASIEEANLDRRESRQTWRLDPSSKLMVAARIAAAHIFSDRSEIWTGLHSESAPAGSMNLSDIVGGYEPALGSLFPVGEADLREVLLTSLFTRLRPDVFAWTHKTFPEFLAAHYMVEHGLNAEQALNFLRGGGADNIPPQLHVTLPPSFIRA